MFTEVATKFTPAEKKVSLIYSNIVTKFVILE